jgi:hypothetical protein
MRLPQRQIRWGQALPRTESYPVSLKRRGAGGTERFIGTTARKEARKTASCSPLRFVYREQALTCPRYNLSESFSKIARFR